MRLIVFGMKFVFFGVLFFGVEFDLLFILSSCSCIFILLIFIIIGLV